MTTSGPFVLASACWPESESDTRPPPLAGFIASSFSPLVAAVADRCLSRHFGAAPVDPATGERTAVVIVSVDGDVATGAAVAAAVDGGDRMSPLLFFQSVPNAAAGRVASRWGLAGPVVCLSPPGDETAGAEAARLQYAGLQYAAELIGDGDADRVLLLLVEQEPAGGLDRATALLVAPPIDEQPGERSP